jgi:hypothetical protein
VSLLSREELRVVLCRDELQLVRLAVKLGFRGWSYSLLEKKKISFDVDSNSTTIWTDALNKLEAVLTSLQKKPDFTSIVLANHFLRYALVEGDKALKSEVEQVAFVKHRFGQLYGESANNWDVRIDQEYPGAPFIASAVDRDLILRLREIFQHADLKLHSIQPCLMKAYNLTRSALENKNAWFVMFEHGNLCLAWLSEGHISSVRTVKVGGDWQERLTEIIDRETHLTELDTSTKEIYLMSFDDKKVEIPKNIDWRIYKLNPEIPPGLFEHYDERFALAICE